MPIRLRASDFCQVPIISIVLAIETGSLCEMGCGDGALDVCLFARVTQSLGFVTQNVQANVDYRYVWCREETRRVHFARPRTHALKPALTDCSLAAKRLAAACQAVLFSTTHPHPAR